MRQEIDRNVYKKRNLYDWFKKYGESEYGFDVDRDVDRIVRLSKERKESFFEYFFFAVRKGVNSIDERKIRLVDGKAYLYDRINPTRTVRTKEGVYQNSGFLREDDFKSFKESCRKTVEAAKNRKVNGDLNRFSICDEPNVVYATCIPLLNFKGRTHPTPTGDQEALSVPRICWGKYYLGQDNKYHVTLNIIVSHLFVDGYPLANCFNQIQSFLSSSALYQEE